MKPPVCYLCGKDFEYDFISNRPVGGDIVQFHDYQPLPDDMDGHPQGAEWFCDKHLTAAGKLSRLSLGEAMRKLKKRWLFW